MHSRHLKNCYTCSPYNPGQKASKLWPNILKWKVIIQFSGPSPPLHPLPRSNVGIVGLLEMNQHRYCVGRFEVGVRLRWIERPYVCLLARTVVFTAEFSFPVLFCGALNLVLSYRRLRSIQHLREQEEREEEICPLSARRGGGEVRWS